MFQFAQNEATASRRRIFFYAVDATDGYTAITASITSGAVLIVKNGTTPGTTPVSPTFTHISNGLWYYEMTTGHLDTQGVVTVTITGTNIRTAQLIGYVYAGDPMASIPTFPTNFSSLAITGGGAVTAGTVSDKTGYSLSGTQTFNVTGNITGNLSGSVGSVTGAVGSVTGAVGSVTGAVGSVTGAVGSVTGNVGGNVTGSVGTLTAAAVQNIWDDATTNNTVVGSVGKLIVDNLNATVSSRSTLTAANVWDALETSITTTSSIGLKLKTNLDAAISTRMATFTYTAPPTAATISTQVWTEPIPGTFAVGSAGAKLNSASSAGDPWNTAVPGSYAAGTAGFILGTNLNATISSRMATFTYTAPPTVAQIWQTDVSGFSTVGQAGTYLKNAMPTFTYTAPLTSGQTASAVWDALLASYTVNNSFGQRVLRSTTSQSACAVTGANHIAADVHELQPAVITAADFTAGAIDANALAASAATEIAVATWNTDVSSSYVSPTAGYGVWQGLIESSNGKALAEQMTLPAYQQSMADYLLGRNIAGGSDGGRTVKDAFRALRNKSEIVGSTLTVYAENDTTAAWTAAVSSSGSAVPVTGIDPV